MTNTLYQQATSSITPIDIPLPVKVIMIDLDGTLLSTAEDLALAANLMLRELGQAELPTETIASYIGKGITRLVERTLTNDIDGKPDSDLLAQALPIYNRHYAENVSTHTCPYPGVLEGIKQFLQDGFHLACITNKSEVFTLPLLEATGLLNQFEIVLSGDSLPKRKPDPMPLTHICKHFRVQPDEALLIGDSLNDAIAARAAGCHIFCVPYGYNEGRDIRLLDCDAIVDTLHDASKLVKKIACPA